MQWYQNSTHILAWKQTGINGMSEHTQMHNYKWHDPIS